MTRSRDVATQGGLVLISSTTIGSAVSSVSVNNVFSSTYENYKVIVTGGVGSTSANIGFRLGATTSGYFGSLIYFGYGSAAGSGAFGAPINNAVNFLYAGTVLSTNGIDVNVDLKKPFIAKTTSLFGQFFDGTNSGVTSGYLNNTISYTDFTIVPSSGTLTGGTIEVYGYK